MSVNHGMQSEIVEELKKINLLLSSLLKTQIQPILEKELSDETRRKIYDLTGDTTVKEIAKKTGVAVGTVSMTWNRWEQLGIIHKNGKSYQKILE